MGFQKFYHRLHSDLRRLILREAKHTCGNATERNAFYSALYCKFKTALITAFQQFAVLFGQPALHYRSDCVDYIIAWQIVCRSDFSCTCRFFMPLCFHYLRTFQPQANTCKSVDTVVYTVVARMIASCHSRICSIHYRTAFQRCDVAFPKINIFLNWL